MHVSFLDIRKPLGSVTAKSSAASTSSDDARPPEKAGQQRDGWRGQRETSERTECVFVDLWFFDLFMSLFEFTAGCPMGTFSP